MEESLQGFAVIVIRKILIEKNIPQKQLADNLLISRQMISNYLTGKTEFTLNMFEQICAAVNVSVSSVLGKYGNDSEIELDIPENNHKKIILQQRRRITELERDKIFLTKAIERCENDYQKQLKIIDKLEIDLSASDVENEKLKNKIK